MPYIVLKRSDIPDGVLQILDVKPYTSQRKPSHSYEPVGQTRYLRAPQNDALKIQTAGGLTKVVAEAKGLAAWFATNVHDGSGVAATGSITTVAEASLVDGETVTITDDTGTAYVFEFDLAGGDGVGAGNIAVVLGGAATADDVKTALISAINGTAITITATDGGAATVSLTADTVGTAANVAITETVANAGFVVAGMSGGVDNDALTATEAQQNASDVLDLVAYGAAGAPAAVTLAGINAAITTGAITSGQVAEILALLAGKEYVVPAGTQTASSSAFSVSPAVGADGGPGFTDGTLRPTYATSDLKLSYNEGHLSELVKTTYEHKGSAGRAVVVYNDDGSLYTG